MEALTRSLAESAKARYVEVRARWDHSGPLTFDLIREFLHASFGHSAARLTECLQYPHPNTEENARQFELAVQMLNFSLDLETPEERLGAIRWLEFQARFERRKIIGIVKDVKTETGLESSGLTSYLAATYTGREIEECKRARARFWEAIGLLRSVDEDRMVEPEEEEFTDLVY